MESSRRLVLAAGIGIALIALAAASDFLVGSFWSGHAMLTSLIASLLVLAVTVAVINEWVERRGRRRWSVLAQYVLFQLVQAARVTWTTLIELLERGEIDTSTPAALRAVAERALRTAEISTAARDLLANPERRTLLSTVLSDMAAHSRAVVVAWASVMVGSGPYTDLFDHFVELQARLDWVSELLAATGSQEGRSTRETKLGRSSVATEHVAVLGNDDWLHDQLVTTIQLAVRLDYESRTLGFSLVPMEWWEQRTQEALGELALSG